MVVGALLPVCDHIGIVALALGDLAAERIVEPVGLIPVVVGQRGALAIAGVGGASLDQAVAAALTNMRSAGAVWDVTQRLAIGRSGRRREPVGVGTCIAHARRRQDKGLGCLAPKAVVKEERQVAVIVRCH